MGHLPGSYNGPDRSPLPSFPLPPSAFPFSLSPFPLSPFSFPILTKQNIQPFPIPTKTKQRVLYTVDFKISFWINKPNLIYSFIMILHPHSFLISLASIPPSCFLALFSIQASSAASERLFSHCGNTSSSVRSQMMPGLLDSLIQIKGYMKSPIYDFEALMEQVCKQRIGK